MYFICFKHSFQGYFDCLCLELQDKNIKVMIAVPSPVKSEVAQLAFTEKPGVVGCTAEHYFLVISIAETIPTFLVFII